MQLHGLLFQEEEQEDMTVVLSKTKSPSTTSLTTIKEKEKPVLSFTEQNEFNQQVNKNKKKVARN